VPGFVNYKKGCTGLAGASDKVYQLLAHGRWFSPGSPTFSTTKTGRHDIAQILLKVALNTINQATKSTTQATTDVLASFISDIFVMLFSFFFHSFIHCHDNL